MPMCISTAQARTRCRPKFWLFRRYRFTSAPCSFFEVLAWSCTDPCEKILWRSCCDPPIGPKMSLHDLAQVLLRRFCGDPGEVLSNRSLHGPVQLLDRRFCGDPGKVPLQEVLAWRSCRCHVLEVLLRKLFWDALERFLYQDLVRSFPATAGPFMTLLWDSLRCEKILCMEILLKSSPKRSLH